MFVCLADIQVVPETAKPKETQPKPTTLVKEPEKLSEKPAEKPTATQA